MNQTVINKNRLHTNKQLSKVLTGQLIWKIIIAVITYVIVFVIMLYSISPKRYNLKVGDIPNEPIRAPRDIENKIATQKRIEQAKQSVSPIYRFNQDIKINTIEEVNQVFEEINVIRGMVEKRFEEFKREQQNDLDDSNLEGNTEGVTVENTDEPPVENSSNDNQADSASNYDQILDKQFLEQLKANLSVELSNEELIVCIKTDESEIMQLQEHLIQILFNLLDLRIKEDNLLEAKNTLRNEILTLPLSNDLRLVGTTIGLSLLKPNMVYDREATEAEKEKAAQEVEKVFFKKGQYIVQDGQPVTEEQYMALVDLGLIKNEQYDLPLMLGLGFIVLLLEIIVILYIYYFENELMNQPHILTMLSVIFCLVLGLGYGIKFVNPYFIPAAMAAILITILIKPSIAFIINAAIAVLLGVMTNGQFGVVVAALFSGMLAIYMSNKSQQRSTLVWTGMLISASSMLTIMGYEMMVSGNWLSAAKSSFWGIGGGVFASVLALGTLPIWEYLFGIITPIRLIELSNPNQPLLKRLLMEAPGTYHHSIIVANLAESAAEAVGANGILARVGAYYHDIGKLSRPYYFRENQLSSDNPHDRLDPALSASIIISHARDGVKLAQKYKVPKILQDFMLQHHGTTPVIYFYHKSKNNSDNPNDVKLDDFRYAGPKPQSPETAIVMLADTVEAAVRSLPEPTSEKIDELIRRLIKEKLEDGQLDECRLTLKDLDSIATAFKNVICGIFHERVEYPDVDLNEERGKTNDG
ncbi:MAG: HDIG domain-containing protein [Clostridiales bacterium]|nr:HDIG domain-containing protein [Clostridiales bacterium]